MMQGFQAAMDAGATEVAVFTAASEQVVFILTDCVSHTAVSGSGVHTSHIHYLLMSSSARRTPIAALKTA